MITDKKTVAQRNFEEATRLISNAKKELILAKKNGNVYDDVKHMRMACGTAYIGALKAVDGIFLIRDIPFPRGRRSIEYYKAGLSKLDKKMLDSLNIAYSLLHINGYYDEVNSVKAISAGFEEVENLLKKLKQML